MSARTSGEDSYEIDTDDKHHRIITAELPSWKGQ